MLFAAACCVLSATATSYFVSNSGSDENPGTNLAVPFRTLERAALALEPGDTCFIRGGIYRETLMPQRSGTSNAPITYAAYPGEGVTLTGADPITGWVRCSNDVYAAQVGPVLPAGRNQVFVDGIMVSPAKYPHGAGRGWFHPATVSLHIDGGDPHVIASGAFAGHPDNFWAGAWFYGGVGDQWSWQCARVLSSSGNTVTVEPGTKSQPWFTGDGVGYLWGLLGLLGGDDEWQLQPSTAGASLYLRLAGNPAAHTVEIKRRDWCVDVQGQNYITIHGLWLRAGAVRLEGQGNVLEDCHATLLSHFQNFASGYAGNGGFAAGGGVVISGNDNVVRRCVIGNTAGSGIISTGTGNTITRNLIYNTDYSGTYACAIRLNGQLDRVTFNTAHHSGRDILQPGGGGHDIFFNDFALPGQMCRDLGVIYIWGTNGQIPSGQRTRIAYNWIHDNLGASGTCPLIYLDNYCRNFTVDHNVIWDCIDDAGIRINGPASGDRLYNNTLFNCENLGARTYDMWPNNNPAPAFWTSDIYGFSAANNLYLSASPNTVLRDWEKLDFRPWRTSDQGAYGSGLRWTAGVRGAGLNAPGTAPAEGQPGTVSPPPLRLSVGPSSNRSIILTAPAAAAGFRLYAATNLQPPVVWFPVTNTPTLSNTQWSMTLPVVPGSARWFRLQAN